MGERATGVPGFAPDWPAPARVRAWFTTRGDGAADGASGAPWQFFNLGDHVGDVAAAVAANRARLTQALGARPVFMNQVHGVHVARLEGISADGLTADAAISTQPGLACTLMVADCLPVLITDTAGSAVAASHAGWRGLAGGVLEQTVTRFRSLSAETAGELLAWLGPCIGPRAFEVGVDVRDAFVAQDGAAAAHFQPLGAGKYLADLPALARRRLAALGVTRVHGNDGGQAWCTVAQERRFHSHRRDQRALGGSGRMAASVWLVPGR